MLVFVAFALSALVSWTLKATPKPTESWWQCWQRWQALGDGGNIGNWWQETGAVAGAMRLWVRGAMALADGS